MSYDKLIALTLKAYIRPMLDEMYGKGFTSDMTDEELDDMIKVLNDAPYRCGECGQMVEGSDESNS